MDCLPNFNQSNIVIALRAALAAAAILYVLEIYDIKNGMGHLGFLAVVLRGRRICMCGNQHRVDGVGAPEI